MYTKLSGLPYTYLHVHNKTIQKTNNDYLKENGNVTFYYVPFISSTTSKAVLSLDLMGASALARLPTYKEWI